MTFLHQAPCPHSTQLWLFFLCAQQKTLPFPVVTSWWVAWSKCGKYSVPPPLNFSLEIVVELASQLCVYLQHQTCLVNPSLSFIVHLVVCLQTSSASPSVSCFTAVFVNKEGMIYLAIKFHSLGYLSLNWKLGKKAGLTEENPNFL